MLRFQSRRAGGNQGFLEANLEPSLYPADLTTVGAELRSTGAWLLLPLLMGAAGCALGGVYGGGSRFHLQKQNNYNRNVFFAERKFYFRFLLILAQETRPGCQGIFHNIGIITHLISHGIFQKQTGSLNHWCV